MDLQRLDQFWKQIRNNPARFGLALSVVVVGLLLWGRLILLERVPRIATADPQQKQASVEEDQTGATGETLPDRHNPDNLGQTEKEALQSPPVQADDRHGRRP